MFSNLILLFISVLPVVIIGIYIYSKDKDKESKKLLIKLFIGGIGSCFLTLFVSGILTIVLDLPIYASDYQTTNLLELVFNVFIGIALVEEGCKWFIAYKFAYHDYNFDEFYDAIIYCIFVALGFAFFENLLYVFDSGIGTGIARALLAVPGHACDGVFMGYYFGLAKISDLNNNKKLRNKHLIFSILVPTILHGIYDYCLFTESVFFLVIFFIFVICLYVFAIKKVKRVSSINKKIQYGPRYCAGCGHPVDSNYCPNCGNKVR